MEKVKITQELKNTIEVLRDQYSDDEIIDKHCIYQKNRHLWAKRFDVMNDVPMSLLSRALHRGYEVEPEFKVGDWVKSRHGIGTGKITKIDEMGYCTDFNMIAASDDIRHATPEEIATEKERRFFAENGRKPWELRGYDLLMSPGVVTAFEVDRVVGEKVFMGNHAYENLENIKRNYRVACFAEDRKDI